MKYMRCKYSTSLPFARDLRLRAHRLAARADARSTASLVPCSLAHPQREAPPSHSLGLPTFCQDGLMSYGDGVGGVSPGCVVEGLVAEHCDEQGEEAISDTAQGAAVAVTDLSQGLVAVFGPGIPLGANASPVVEGIAQALVAAVASADSQAFAALRGHRRDTAEGAQGVVISLGKKLRSFGEHRGGDDSSDPWQRQKDFDVAMLAPLFLRSDSFLQCGLNGFGAEFELSDQQLHPWQQESDVSAGGLRDAGGDGQRGCLELGTDLIDRPLADAVLMEQPLDAAAAQPLGFRRRRGELEQSQEPGLVSRRAQAQQLRIEPQQEIPQLVGQPGDLRVEIFFDAGQFPDLDGPGIVQMDTAEGGKIRPERIGQHEGVPPVILRSGHRVAIAEAVELLWIDREDMKASLDQGFDHSPARYLNGDSDRGRVTAGQPDQSIDHRGDGLGPVLHAALLQQPSLSIQHAHLMSLRGPVEPDHQPVAQLHVSSFLFGQPWSPSVPVLALEAQLPTGCLTTVHSAGTQVRGRRSRALGDSGAPDEAAELEKNFIDRPVLPPADHEAHEPKGTGRLLAPRAKRKGAFRGVRTAS